jgi:histidinol dehydrogenase
VIVDEGLIGPVEDHRGREGGLLVYPVYSRRSGGLSLGINLFPDRKLCSFDCPYCEVFPFETGFRFSPEFMGKALTAALHRFRNREVPVRDICFSGNGEPTISPHFAEALEIAVKIRDTAAPGTALVLITNGTGLLNDRIFELLHRAAAGPPGLCVWLKLDAGTEDWYARMNRSSVPFTALIKGIREFVDMAPATIQTMLCAVGGREPPPEEALAWERLVTELARLGDGRKTGVRRVQIYGKARPAPEDPLARPLPPSHAEARAASLRSALAVPSLPPRDSVPVEVFM